MKPRILSLLFAALLAGAFSAGCAKTVGGTVTDAATPSNAAPPPADPNLTPADPAAKKAMEEKASADADKAATSKPGEAAGSSSENTAGDGATMPKAGDKVAVIDTNMGRIVFKFLPDKAPKTIKNFEKLTGQKFYDGTKFHRVIPQFMIQGGDPNTKGTDTSTYGMGGPGYTIDDEFSDVSHVRGIVSMAHTGAPNSGGSQFFICVGDASFLDHKYSAFGQVVKGMDVADKIVNLPVDSPQHNLPTPDEAVMKTVRIETWPLKG